MSKLNIYETKWLDLVFEGRNKAYGAYQLRSENPKTTLKALCTGVLLLGSAIAVPIISNYFKPDPNVAGNIPKLFDDTIVVVDLIPTLPKKIEEPKLETTPSDPVKKIKFTGFTPVPKNQATQEVPTNDELKNAAISSENAEGTGTTTSMSVASQPTGNGDGNGTESNNAVNATYELEALPQYPGGIDAFLSTIGKRFKTPELEDVKTLKVLVYFIVEKDGSLSNIRVTRDPGYGLGKEAIRVLSTMTTKWSPGYRNGNAVRTAYNLPITVNVN
ncbi:energy transducer TonB [Flavobacterium cerinum]|uniref:Energy transducer TonB n=1 Tax=Flavobacterium cerinum TaxID=2502784 RepID=A0ABY5IY98_9FLAO|nr:energy transducer TonB [Flavobacterium cerinum]UUC47122.1 energy transducer TonB [Flavobacterium cerinum]